MQSPYWKVYASTTHNRNMQNTTHNRHIYNRIHVMLPNANSRGQNGEAHSPEMGTPLPPTGTPPKNTFPKHKNFINFFHHLQFFCLICLDYLSIYLTCFHTISIWGKQNNLFPASPSFSSYFSQNNLDVQDTHNSFMDRYISFEITWVQESIL